MTGEPERDDESDGTDTPAADEDGRQSERATHLSKRAGESVGRRYDATKEVHHDEHE